MKKYNYLIFDLDNTLLDFDNTEEQALSSLFREYKVPVTVDARKRYKEINSKLWASLERGEITREDIFNTRFSLFFNDFNMKVDGIKAEESYRNHLNNGYAIIENADVLLSQLKEKNYHIYAGTNGVGSTQRERLRGSQLLPYFDELFISEEIGYEKPDKNFFQTLFDTLAITNKESCLMIGDSLSSDILGAKNAEIDSVFYCPDKTIQSSSATYTVNNLMAIYSLLED